MSTDRSKLTDSVSAVLGKVTRKPRGPASVRSGARPTILSRKRLSPERERQLLSKFHIVGFVQARLFGPDGNLKQLEQGYNLVTDHGDEHVGERMYDDTYDIVTGMRLGTGATAASKAGAGAAIVTYETGSQEALDAVPVGVDKGAGLGWRVPHICTWIAGDVTETVLAEVVLTDETALTDVAGTAANTVARFVFGATIDKQAGDSLEVTWNIDFLGA